MPRPPGPAARTRGPRERGCDAGAGGAGRPQGDRRLGDQPIRSAKPADVLQIGRLIPSSPCRCQRFEESVENGLTIVHMTTGVAVALWVPAGVSVDGWGQTVPSPGTGCDTELDLIGPGEWTGCEATLRWIGELTGG